MTHQYGILRRFRFNRPQRVAAGLLALFLAQGFARIASAQAAAPLLPGPLLLRLAMLVAGCLLGGCIWWVTRRLYGNRGGYTALALYCFSPAVLRACAAANVEMVAALGVFGGVYTCIGVAHAMQGPAAKWRPRIVLLTAALALAAAADWAALPVAAVLGLVLMLWIAEGRRGIVLPVVMASAAGAAILVAALDRVAPGLILSARSAAAGIGHTATRSFFFAWMNTGGMLAAAAALALYVGARRSRYFGNTAPLFCAVALMLPVVAGAPGVSRLWALPFLLTFVGGVFADAYEEPRGGLAMGAAAAMVLLQAVVCVMSLAGPG